MVKRYAKLQGRSLRRWIKFQTRHIFLLENADYYYIGKACYWNIGETLLDIQREGIPQIDAEPIDQYQIEGVPMVRSCYGGSDALALLGLKAEEQEKAKEQQDAQKKRRRQRTAAFWGEPQDDNTPKEWKQNANRVAREQSVQSDAVTNWLAEIAKIAAISKAHRNAP